MKKQPHAFVRLALVRELTAAVDAEVRRENDRRSAPRRDARIERARRAAHRHIAALRQLTNADQLRFSVEDAPKAKRLLDWLGEQVDFYACWYTLPRNTVSHRPDLKRFRADLQRIMDEHRITRAELARLSARIAPSLSQAGRDLLVREWPPEQQAPKLADRFRPPRRRGVRSGRRSESPSTRS